VRCAAGRSFILSVRFPRWDIAPDLIWFYDNVVKDEAVVEAILHVVHCDNPECKATEPDVVRFLHRNPDYLFEILGGLLACRNERRGIGPF
jgi:hypothetical protein